MSLPVRDANDQVEEAGVKRVSLSPDSEEPVFPQESTASGSASQPAVAEDVEEAPKRKKQKRAADAENGVGSLTPRVRKRKGKSRKDARARSPVSIASEGRTPERRPRRSRSRGKNKTMMMCAVQSGMMRRSATSTEGSGSAQDLQNSRVRLLPHDHMENLPACIGQGNLMLANWAVGKEASIDNVGRILGSAPFDCVVMVLTSAVAETDPIAKYLADLDSSRNDAKQWDNMHPQVAQIHFEKAVYKCSSRVYVAIHKAKVKGVMYVERLKRCEHQFSLPLAVVTDQQYPAITFGTLTLRMDQTRQRYEEIKIGIVDMRGRVNSDWHAGHLVEWIVSDRLAAVTGHFGENCELVAEIAERANAVHFEPLMQRITWQDPQLRHWRTLTFPNYWLFFGYYRTIAVAAKIEPLPESLAFAEDLWDETTLDCGFPTWTPNDEGSPFVPNLGAIKMKDIDWNKWVDNVFQQVLWLGTATPSHNSQEKQKKRKGKGWGKSWGKGWGKGGHKNWHW